MLTDDDKLLVEWGECQPDSTARLVALVRRLDAECERLRRELEPGPRWVPVAERRPKPGWYYVVWAGDIWTTRLQSDGVWPQGVTHWLDWQPPPPPPPEPATPKPGPGVRFERTGEHRVPKEGEWFESIASGKPCPRYPADVSPRWILRRVEVPG